LINSASSARIHVKRIHKSAPAPYLDSRSLAYISDVLKSIIKYNYNIQIAAAKLVFSKKKVKGLISYDYLYRGSL
jgi:hypothetical protein